MATDLTKGVTLAHTEKLDLVTHNWPDWQHKIKTICELKGLDGHLDGTSQQPQPVTSQQASSSAVQMTMMVLNQAEIDTWDTDDKMTKAIIKINVNNFPTTGINPSMMGAHQLWTALANQFKQRGLLGRMNVIDLLWACKYKDGMSLAQHWVTMHACRMNVSHFRDPVPDNEFSIILCDSVSDTLKGGVEYLYTLKKPEEVIDAVTTIYQRRMAKAGKHVQWAKKLFQ